MFFLYFFQERDEGAVPLPPERVPDILPAAQPEVLPEVLPEENEIALDVNVRLFPL